MHKRLPYRILSIFFIFAIVLVVPLVISVYNDISGIMVSMDTVYPLTGEQRVALMKYKEGIVDNIILLSFYVFILAFIVAMLFARRLLAPLRSLGQALRELSQGRCGTRLEYVSGDEMGDLAKSFNDAARFCDERRQSIDACAQLIGSSPVVHLVLDEDHIIRDVSPAFEKLFGYSRQESLGYPVFEFLEEDAAKKIRRRIVESGGEASIAHRADVVSRRDGMIPVWFDLVPRYEAGALVGMVGYMRDLREEAALERALWLERENAEALMDSTADMLMVVDRDYRVVSANLAMRVHYGRDIKGEHCHMVLYQSADRCYLRGDPCSVKEVFDTGSPFKALRTMYPPGESPGTPVFFDTMASAMKDSAGEVKHVAISMRDITERVKLDEQIDSRSRELSALNAISRLLSKSLNAQDIYEEVMDSICGLFGMDGGAIYFQDDMGRTLRCEFYKGLSAEFIKSVEVLALGDDIPGKVAGTGVPAIIPDIMNDPRGEGSAFRHTGIRGYVCVPIRGKEKLLGVFFAFSFAQKAFSPGDEGILASVSDMMGLSFENTRLYDRMKSLYEQDRQRKVEEQRGLMSLTSMLASSVDMDAVLGSSLDLVKRACWADFAWLLLLDGHGDLVLNASSSKSMETGVTVYCLGQTTLEGSCIERREPVISQLSAPSVSGAQMDSRVGRYVTACCVPVYVGDRPLGALSLYYVSEIVPREDEVHFLRTVGSVIAVSLERARLYESAALQRGMAETVIESIHDGVATMDIKGMVISMNSAASGIFGRGSSRMAGGKIPSTELFGNGEENFEFAQKFMEGFELAVSGRYATFESTLARPDGSRVPIAMGFSPLYAGADNLAGVVAVLRDLSVEREVDRMKTDFVKSVSHEFRTPLTAIVGMTEMVIDHEVQGDRATQYLETVLYEANRLARMVADVLDIARIESGTIDFTPKELDFGNILKNLQELMHTSAVKHEAELSFEVAQGLGPLRGDEEKVKRLLVHLMENSLIYSDPGVRIVVAVRKAGEMIEIEVSDSGWGIPEDDLPHVTERFYRGHVPTEKKGAGLGLAICKEVVSLHGGQLSVESIQGKGTVVIVRFPL